MLKIEIPGRPPFLIKNLVCDVNGTLALDGQLLPSVVPAINLLKEHVAIHMLTADTHGKQTEHAQVLGITSVVLHPGHEVEQKADYVRSLGKETTAAIGQGSNDAAMLKESILGICVLSSEGAAIETLLAADIIVPDIQSAFELFLKPLRLVATLRK